MNAVSRNARIAIIAGPTLLAALSEDLFSRQGWDCHLAASLDSLPGLDKLEIDLLVLDIVLCAGADAETLGWLRESGRPIILIGDGDASPPLPAMAYLPRPFRLFQLFDCVQRALSQPQLPFSSPIPTGLRLTEKETAIFARLAAAKGGSVSRARLLSEIWGFAPGVSTRTLETHIGRLRRKLAAADTRRRLLTTPEGYRLVDSFGTPAENSGGSAQNPLE